MATRVVDARSLRATLPDGKVQIRQDGHEAVLLVGSQTWQFHGSWIEGGPWERFGLYNTYVLVRSDGTVATIPAHAGELVPGSTEDLVAVLRRYDPQSGHPWAPMTLEVDPTFSCTSKDCGGRCFSAAYRRLAPTASISRKLLHDLIGEFAADGGRIVRFDGGGDPLSHPAVRSGELPERVATLGMKSTILTSGDLLPSTNLERIGDAQCYVRVSLNAASDGCRRRFHGNQYSLNRIFETIERLACWIENNGHDPPIGATFLLDSENYSEVLACARRARDSGVSHFSVRRVLGPATLRPTFSRTEEHRIAELLMGIQMLRSDRFRVFVPWRPLGEMDIDPSQGELETSRCWQSTFKTVVEPNPVSGGMRVQLCGRYRGGGIGQKMQLPPLLASRMGVGWTERWRDSFADYGWSREILPHTCSSCIDRGFILMVDRMMKFIEGSTGDLKIFHLSSTGMDGLDVSNQDNGASTSAEFEEITRLMA